MRKRNKNEIIKIPYVKFKPNSVIIYESCNIRCAGSRLNAVNELIGIQNQLSSLENLQNNNCKGILSEKAGARMRSSIKYLFWFNNVFEFNKKGARAVAYKKISMITLTLSSKQRHPDQYIKSKMLNQFLIEIRKYNKKFMFLWRAEKQENGNIHFHILCNIYIPYDLIRSKWNRIQEKEGYLQPYHDKFIDCSFNDYLKIMPVNKFSDIYLRKKAYLQNVKDKWKNPNSTDVHSLKKIKNVYAYVSKYMSKVHDNSLDNKDRCFVSEDKKIDIDNDLKFVAGRLWFACEKINKISESSYQLSNDLFYEIEKLDNDDDIVQKDYIYTKVYCVSAEKLISKGFRYLFKFFLKNIPDYNFHFNLNF